jgi:hypothetical protein
VNHLLFADDNMLFFKAKVRVQMRSWSLSVIWGNPLFSSTRVVIK